MLSISLQTSILLLIIFLYSPLCGSTLWWVSCSKERFYTFRLCLLTVRLVLTINLATVCRIYCLILYSLKFNWPFLWERYKYNFSPKEWRGIVVIILLTDADLHVTLLLLEIFWSDAAKCTRTFSHNFGFNNFKVGGVAGLVAVSVF